jgi:hypothetical protein
VNRRPFILWAVLPALLWAAAGWSALRLSEAKDLAAAAREDRVACRRLAEDIKRLRSGPALATDQQDVADETVRLIESAAASAGIATDRIVSITPGPPQRLGDTVYKEKPTHVMLLDVPLKPLVEMTYRLISGPPALRARALRLSAPRPGDTGDAWNVEMELSYLLYDPPENTRE